MVNNSVQRKIYIESTGGSEYSKPVICYAWSPLEKDNPKMYKCKVCTEPPALTKEDTKIYDSQKYC